MSLAHRIESSKAFKEAIQVNGNTAREDELAEYDAMALHYANRFFGIDSSKVIYTSSYDTQCDGPLRIALFRHGKIWREIFQECGVSGFIHICAIDSQDIADLLSRDILGDITKAWLAGSGYPDNFPVVCGASVTQRGSLSVECCPYI